MKDNGQIIICMEREFINGKTEEVMKDNTSKTKNKAMEFTYGLMGENTKENG